MIEYKIIALAKTSEKIEEELNGLSIQGWRLCGTCGKHNRHFILKRRVVEREEE